MLNKSNLDIGKIGDVFVTPDVTVANDGRMLIEVSRPHVDQDSFLKVDDFHASYINFAGEIRNSHKDFVISSSDALSISKSIKRSKKFPILENASISHNGTTKFATGDPKTLNTNIQKIVPTEEKYPDYKQVIPTGEETTLKIGLNAEMLKEVCSHADKFQNDEYKAIILEFKDNKSAVKITTRNHVTKQNFTAVIMPVEI